MIDLISRSELIKELNKYCGNQRYLVSENIREIINNQPTSYNIDKVVDELEKLKNEKTMGSHKVMIKDAIEIVKQGGVSDDVCEWKQTSTAKYKTGCGYKLEEYFDTKACYCKQCGKKIKVVDR